MSRRTLAIVTFGLLGALLAVAVTVPVGRAVGAVLFAVVLLLVGIWFFRFAPWGDTWDIAREHRLNPWLFVGLVLLFGLGFTALRIAVARMT